MPKIVVEGPDGRKFAFPDTMPRAEINAFMRTKYGTKAPNESVQDYLARYGREQAATEARVKDIDREATAAGRAEGERAAERMGVSNPFEMAFAAPAIGLAQQEGGRRVFEREGTVLADEAAGLSAINAAGFFVPSMVNREFGARVEEGRRQQPLAAFAGDVAGGFGPGEIIGAGVSKAVQAIGPGMAALGRMLSRGPGPDTSNAIVGGTLGGIAPAETAEERARNVAVGAGLGYVARPGSKLAADLTTPSAPNAMPDAMPAGGYFGRQSMRPPGSGPSPREIELRQEWSTATPIVTQARTTAQTAQQAAEAALQSKAPADIARAKAEKKALVGQLQEAQASRAGMDTPEDARLAETLASLTENTSDPVLLSTQISAAKTSLDRLLTDIGSPVEGNLIPVKTNILTRTQAPRTAAEGPQDRASVTRYAAGTDEVKPQGFGAGGSKGPEQSSRFETSNLPTYKANPQKGQGFDEWMETLYSDAVRGPDNKTVLPNVFYRGMSDAEFEAAQKTGKFQSLDKSEGLYVEKDPTRYSGGGAYGAKRSGVIVQFDTTGLTPKTIRARAAGGFAEDGFDEIPNEKIARVWKWDATKNDHVLVYEAPPKTPQQAARFETPGSPEYEAAVAKGLDMSQAGRMARAKEMGFDTETVLYHGTATDVASFDPRKAGGVTKARSAKLGTWLTGSPKTAEGYADFASGKPVQDLIDASYAAERAGQWDKASRLMAEAEALETAGTAGQTIMPLHVRGKLKTIDMDGVQYDPDDVNLTEIAKVAKQEGFDGVRLTNFSDEAGYGQYNPTTHVLVFDPSNIRSVNAAFDPEKSTSSTLLAAAPFAVVGGAGLTSERELGSKMKRDKKD